MFDTLLEPSGLALAALVAGVAIVGLLAERALITLRVRWYYLLGLPLGERLVPVPLPPEGQGRTASVRYAVTEGVDEAFFWAQPGDRTAPLGLHGFIALVPGRRGVALEVRWAPPWTLLLALLWFGGLGVVRGQGGLTIVVATLLIAVVGVLYRQAAVRAARELRWRFVQRDEVEGDP